jgi:hypothetical protein
MIFKETKEMKFMKRAIIFNYDIEIDGKSARHYLQNWKDERNLNAEIVSFSLVEDCITFRDEESYLFWLLNTPHELEHIPYTDLL